MPLSALTLRRVRVGLGILLLGVLLLSPQAARAEGEDPAAIEKVTTLNKKALDAYNNLDFEDARKLLKQALDICASAGLDHHPIKARTHVHMGVVLIATKQPELGMKQFRKALEIQPDIQVTKALANPEITQAFEEAAASGSTDGGGDGAPVEPPPAVGGADQGGTAAEVTGDISLVPVTRAKKGKPLTISATVAPTLTGYAKVVLAYRAEGAGDFEGIDMKKSGTKFVADIPEEATKGAGVQYYVEAEAEDETPVATNGTEEKPYAVALSVDGPPSKKTAGPAAGGGDDGDENAARYFIGLSVGTGTGYTTGNGELNVGNKVKAGFAPASAIQIVPEIGYFLLPQFRLSVQARVQYVTGRTSLNLDKAIASGALPESVRLSCGSDHICSTGSPFAPAVFARGAWFFGSSTFRPYFSLAVGGGIIRHVVKFTSAQPICGDDGKQVCVDSVRAGPIFAGPGGGLNIALSPLLGLIAEVNSVIGFPNFTFNLDFNGGVAAHF